MATKVRDELLPLRETALLSGNEAVAQAAWEAGVLFATGYPGTPSTEILETLVGYPEVRCEWAPNEKVALEVAAGASLGGVRTLVTMKHVGLNVAADPFMTLAYTGVKGGMVIITADDPSMHSSQNEQDNRNYARFGKVPMFEPSDSREVTEYLAGAWDLSERLEIPVLFRMTTRVCHSKSVTSRGARREPAAPSYQKDFVKNVMIPANARTMRVKLEEKLNLLRAEVETHPANRIESGSRGIGVITSGNVYNYVREALPEASVLKLGLTYPLPAGLVRQFAASVEKCYVVEELDPYLETEIRALGVALAAVPAPRPPIGELSPEAVAAMFGVAAPQPAGAALPELAPRPPVLCPGCSHRAVFMTLKKMRLTVTGDIGCYTLGALPPLASMDTCLCMGASIGMGYGLERALGPEATERVVAVIGDSTFLHSGITPLLNVVYNGGHTVTIILDNRTTAMTGHNENPGSGHTLDGGPAPAVDYRALVRALGVEFAVCVDPYDVDKFRQAVEMALLHPGPAVVIAQRPCVLLPEVRGKHKPTVNYDSDTCTACGVCFRIGCPAIEKDAATGKPRINSAFCTGCGLCTTACPCGALSL